MLFKVQHLIETYNAPPFITGAVDTEFEQGEEELWPSGSSQSLLLE